MLRVMYDMRIGSASVSGWLVVVLVSICLCRTLGFVNQQHLRPSCIITLSSVGSSSKTETPAGGGAAPAESRSLLTKSLDIVKRSIRQKDTFSQTLAELFAGDEFDEEKVWQAAMRVAQSAPVVIFGWKSSLYSKKAIKLLNSIGVDPVVSYLDDPWSEGNPIRAVLGRRLGRASVPFIYIQGKFIGGCEDGPSEAAPGLIPLAFQGALLPMLKKAGLEIAVLKKTEELHDVSSIISDRMTLNAATTVDEQINTMRLQEALEEEAECPSDNECELP